MIMLSLFYNKTSFFIFQAYSFEFEFIFLLDLCPTKTRYASLHYFIHNCC